MKVNAESVFDGLLPRVSVSRVYVQDSGNYKKESNPHIDFEGEATYGATLPNTKQAEAANAELKYFANAGSDQKTKQLEINLNLLVKDYKTGKGLFSWLSNFDLQKYLNIYILPVYEPGILENGKLRWFKNQTPSVLDRHPISLIFSLVLCCVPKLFLVSSILILNKDSFVLKSSFIW